MATTKRKGWRRASLINTVIITVVTIFGTVLLIYSAVTTGGINTNLIVFTGSCSKAESIDLWLHLLLNILSTGVLASSNFFMQVLGSPSRWEVEKAHRQNTYLSIGVSGMSNLRHLSMPKAWLWAFFFITSIPFHFFFNSAVFSTRFMGSVWHLTIASGGFVHGAEYAGPGAVLWAETMGPNESYGPLVNLTDYFNSSSSVSRDIQYAAENGGKWKRLEVPECLSQYSYCAGHNTLRDVIWVVKSPNPSATFMVQDTDQGWNSSLLLKMDQLTQTERDEWEQNVPYQSANSLWFAANCTTVSTFDVQGHKITGCSQSCSRATGSYEVEEYKQTKSPNSIAANFTYDFFSDLDNYDSQATDGRYATWHFTWPGIQEKSAGQLDLQYCLAEERAESCKVGLSNTLLMIVVVSVWIKTTLCFGTVFYLSRKEDPPLVVPGDAIASFICSPDYHTMGRCSLDRLTTEKFWGAGAHAPPPTPSRWEKLSQSWRKTVPRRVWGATYLLFVFDVIFITGMFAIAQKSSPIHKTTTESLLDPMANGTVDQWGESADRFVSSVLRANWPQMILSISYFFYNGLFTRLCVEKEWKSYSMKYQSLRVTSPNGEQRSTYRLQLPYRYSIPLICISITLHWVVSNVLYVFVYEGGYFQVTSRYGFGVPTVPAGSGLSQDAYLSTGYSTVMLLTLLLLAIVFAPIPLLLASRKARGQIPNGGSNSMVIASACHVPILLNPPQPTDDEAHCSVSPTPRSYQIIPIADLEQQQSPPQGEEPAIIGAERYLVASNTSLLDDGKRKVGNLRRGAEFDEYLVGVSEGPVRWGEVKYTRMPELQDKELCAHLSFGSPDHEVQDPVDGRLYY